MAAARRLYLERGLEGVTIAAIAAEAGVAPRTFFGYFDCKEDVFLGAGDDRVERVVLAIRERKPGEPILAAVRRELVRDREPAAADRTKRRPELGELMTHPSIVARLRERWIKWEDELAACIADEVGASDDDPQPLVVAAAITSAIRVAAERARRHPDRRQALTRRVFELLASGLSDYGRRRVRPGSERATAS